MISALLSRVASRGVTVAFFTGVALATAPACRRIDPVDLGAPLGEAGDDESLAQSAFDGVLFDEALDLSRAALWGGDAPTPTLESLPGRRAFLCAYGLDDAPICGTGVGQDLEESVRTAALDSKRRARGKLDTRTAGLRLKVDIVERVEPAQWSGDPSKVDKEEIARFGIWVRGTTTSAYVLPSEILEQDIYHFTESKKKKLGLGRKALESALEQRSAGFSLPAGDFPYDAFWTYAAVEKDAPGVAAPPPLALYRTHGLKYDGAAPDLLLQRAVWAADHLISSVSEDGRIRYEYNVSADKDRRSYNILRHAGTTYSILQAYDRTKYEPYLRASVKAIEYYFSFCRWDERKGPYGGGKTYWATSSDEGNYIKLGGVGLGLVMLSQYAEATGDHTTYLEQARGFGRYLASQLKEDGEFHYFAPVEPTQSVKDEYSAYYPGEAILGLVRLYQWDPDPKWLEIAERAAAWLIDVRDKGKSVAKLENDHWLMIALSYLHATTGKATYLEHSIKLAEATAASNEKNEKAKESYPDFVGSYYRPPRNTPAAVRGEGLTAVLDTCKNSGTDCAFVRDLLERTAQHVMLSQFTPDLNYWPRNRAKAFGGITGGIADASIRNDYVQHAMSAILGLERHIRAELGVVVPGGPQWTKRNLAGERFPGIDAAAMAALRAESLRHRGPTLWEIGSSEGSAAAPGAVTTTDRSATTAPSGSTPAEDGGDDDGGE